MKDSECNAYVYTYKCDCKDCEGCKYRYTKNSIIKEIEEEAKQEDCPLYLGDKQIDSYIRLSSVVKIIERYMKH